MSVGPTTTPITDQRLAGSPIRYGSARAKVHVPACSTRSGGDRDHHRHAAARPRGLSARPEPLPAASQDSADQATAAPNLHRQRDTPGVSTPPRFPPLEVFERRPSAASQPSCQGRHPKAFTQADIGPSPRSGNLRRGHRFRRLSPHLDIQIDLLCRSTPLDALQAWIARASARASSLRFGKRITRPRTSSIAEVGGVAAGGRSSTQAVTTVPARFEPDYCVGQGIAACTVVTGPTPLLTNFCRRLPV
jgi:hypothetical protein